MQLYAGLLLEGKIYTHYVTCSEFSDHGKLLPVPLTENTESRK